MDEQLLEQYNQEIREPTRKRKLIPPDGKPVELSVCAKLCHELFIDLKDSNAEKNF
jgi:diaphanous 1